MRHWEHLDLLISLFYFSTYRINCKLKNKSIGKRGLKNLSLQIPATVVGVLLDLFASTYPVTKCLAILSVNHRSCAENMTLDSSIHNSKWSRVVSIPRPQAILFFMYLQGSKDSITPWHGRDPV